MPVQSSPGSFGAVHRDYGLPGEQLEDYTRQFVAASATDPFGCWFILPTQRLVTEISRHLTTSTIAFIPSHICTIDSFCKSIFEEYRTTERFLSKTESKLLLSQLLADDPSGYSLFLVNGRPSSGTVDDLLTFMNVTLTRRVAFPECLLELESEKSRQLDAIITGYRDRLNEYDLVDSDTILEWTIDFLNRIPASPLSKIFVYGFHEPLRLEQDLFNSIAERSEQTHFFVPSGRDPHIFKHTLVAGDATGHSSRDSQITGLFSETGPLDTVDFLSHRTFTTRYAEMYGIASEIAHLNSSGTPLSDIVVAFPDLRENLALIEEVFSDFGMPWNAAVGPQLFRSPVIQFLIGILDLAASGHSRENIVRLVKSPFFRKDVVPGGTLRLIASEVDLVSRYAMIDGPHPSWDRQLAWLQAELQDPANVKKYPGITIHSVERVREGITLLRRDLDTLTGTKQVWDHISAFQKFLVKWNIPDLKTPPDEQVHETEIRAYNKFISRLQALASSGWMKAGETIDPGTFSRFVAAIADESDDGARQDSPGVRVLGLFECSHQKFPVVFIGGLTEGTFPRLTTRLPFTNSLENARMGTRTLSEILREVQYYFIAALLSAKNTVYLSAPLADGEKILLTSAFFERVRMRTGDSSWPGASLVNTPVSSRTAGICAGNSIRDQKICAALPLVSSASGIDDLAERINMERFYRQGVCDSPYDGILSDNAEIRSILATRYGPDHVYSPTNLEVYANCPFAYLLNRVIGLEALPEVEPNLSASDRGTVIHDILSTFYRQWLAAGKPRVSISSLADATELILRIAKEDLERYSFSSPIWDATRVQMLGNATVGPGYLERFLENESREAESPLAPSHFEFSFGMAKEEADDPASSPAPVELASSDGLQRLRIRGRIDRIDLTPEGNFIIYDYKSGVQHPKAKDIEAGSALQLPLYLLAYEQITGSHGIGGGYYTIRREVKRSIVLSDTPAKDLMTQRIRPSPDFAGLLRHTRELAFTYIDGIRNGRFPLPCEEECPNKYCEFKRICRFDPYRVFLCGEET